MTEEKKNIIDPKTGELASTSQYKGDEREEQIAANSAKTEGGDDADVKYHTDTEYRNPEADEADYVSGPTAEGRRTRVDDLPENPSEGN